MEYNGWSNYETWAVKLWMDNDSAQNRAKVKELLEQAKTVRRKLWPTGISTETAMIWTLADLLENYIRESDICDAEWHSEDNDRVNFREIAEYILEKEIEMVFLRCLEKAESLVRPWVLHPNPRTLRNRLKTSRFSIVECGDRDDLEELQRMGLVELSFNDQTPRIWLARFTEQGMAFADNVSPV